MTAGTLPAVFASLRFAGDMHPVLVVGFALLAALAVARLYLAETRTLESPYSYLLPGMRAAAVALAILILAGPVWHRRQTIGTLGRVVFAIDKSKSMSATDSIAGDTSPSRLDRASRLLIGNDTTAGWIERLENTHTIDVIAFSAGEPTEVWTNRAETESPLTFDLVANGQSTDLAAGMSAVSSATSGQNPAAYVMLSEGRDNTGASPIDVAAKLKSQGVKVHTIGIGSIDEPDDIAISRITHPENVSADMPLAGTILLRQNGFAGRQSKLRIEHLGKTIWETEVVFDSNETTIPFEFDLDSIVNQIKASAPRSVERSIVVIDLQATVDAIDGDTRQQNNVRSFRVAASTHEHHLLIVDGSSRWETRYIKNLFSRDPEWSVETLLFGPGTDTPDIVRGDQPDQFPNGAETIGRYDAIVLGEIPADQWTTDDANLLRDFVNRGGGLIVIDGRYGQINQLAANSLADLIPIKHLSLPAVRTGTIRPSRLGMDHPALSLWDEPSEREAFWTSLPAPSSAPDIEAKVGSEVLADLIARDGHRVPWLVTRLYGAGRVIYLSTDQTWRWRYKVADRFHSRFWNQLIATAIQPPYSAGDNYVALGTDKIEYQPGESATIRARLRSAAGDPIGDSTVEALLVANDQIVARVPLQADNPSRGTYRGQTGPLEQGDYSVRIRASGIDQDALQATTPLWVEDAESGELDRISLDSDALRQIADSGGGVYVHESEAESILDKIRPLSSGQIVESDILVWQSFYWFILVMILLTAEWWMRKRAGLM
jgi:uncharacterized membrane protein